MGVYNEEKYVSRAIDSILGQSYKDWRLWICDDGSTDKTLEILYMYEKQFPEKINIIANEKNLGLTDSLNMLIKKTSAKYIARMDGDDICQKERLATEKNFLDINEEYAVVGSIVNKFDENGIFAVSKYPEFPQKKDLLWNSPFAHPTIMIRRDILLKLNGYRNIKKTSRCEDYDLWMRLYEEGYKGYNIQIPLLDYYEGRTSYKKRKYKYRICEAKTRYEGFKKNKLLPLGFVFILKPLITGLIPARIMIKMRNARM